MICPKCGKPVPDGSNFCPQCRADLRAAARPVSDDYLQKKNYPQQSRNYRQQAPNYPQTGRNRGGRSSSLIVLYVLAGVLVVLALVLAGYLIRQHLLGDKTGPLETPSVMEAAETSTPEPTQEVQTGTAPQEEVQGNTQGDSIPPVQGSVDDTPGTGEPVSAPVYYVTGVANQTKVRQGKDPATPVLTKLENHDQVRVLDAGDDNYWKVLVEDEGVEGYIDRHFLTDEPGAVVSPRDMYVISGYLTVLDNNSLNYNSLGDLSKGDKVTVYAEPDGECWYVYAESLRTYGFVLHSCLSDTPPTQAPTPAPATPKPAVPAAPAQPARPATPSDTNIVGYRYVSGVDYYLALRNAPAYDASNEIGKIYNGEEVGITNTWSGNYVWVYSYTLGKWGYVNGDYLTSSYYVPTTPPQNNSSYRTVYGVDYYLALRSAPAYDYYNEIGKLYNGDTVEITGSWSGEYVWVYAPSLGMSGYVNGDYLR